MDALDGIDFTCPACGHHSRYPNVHAGQPVPCPACKKSHVISVGEGSGVKPVVPAAPAAGGSEADKILFTCTSCNYRARIPGQYRGMAVRCPSCDLAQIAAGDDSAPSSGRTVQLSKMPTASRATTVRPGNILFACSQCSFEAQLAKHYVGKAIRCPGCHAPQVVVGPDAPTNPGSALEPTAGAAGASAAPPSDPRFICVACGYRARIPGQYMGLAVTCPKCETVQIAAQEENEGAPTGDTVTISRMKTAEHAPPPATGAPASAAAVLAGAGSGDKVRFTCSGCGFKARIPAAYAGQTIHCPGCNSVQMVLRSGQASAAASGNTQVLHVVETAAASPDAIATPTQTPSRGNPVLPPVAAATAASFAATATGAPPTAKPAAPAAMPVAPAAKPAMAAPAAAAIPPEDQIRFDDDAPAATGGGKVVRRSGRMVTPAAGTMAPNFKTPPPAHMPTPPPAKMKTPAPLESEESEAAEMAALKASMAKPSVSKVPAAKAPAAKAPSTKAHAKPEPKPIAKPERVVVEESSVPQKSSSAMLVVMVLFMVVLLALMGGGGYFGYTQLQQLNAKLDAANAQLKKADEDTKAAKADADKAKQLQEEEAKARKAADDKAADLQKQLDEQKKATEEAAKKAAEAAAPAPAVPAVPDAAK